MGQEGNDTNPRALLLALLQAFGCDVPVQLLIKAAALFGIDENRTRVALHRLRAKSLVESHERGTYRIEGSGGEASVLSWSQVLDRLQTWSGHWIAVHTAPLPRADKTLARRRDRATDQVGLRELQPGLLVRPDNLRGGAAAAQREMVAHGLEPHALVYVIASLGDADAEARGLWSDLALEQRYKAHIERLTRLTLGVRSLEPEEAARQAFIASGEAARHLMADPLLPAPLVDPALREAFVETLVAFDDVGRELWAKVLDTNLELRMSPTAEPTA